MLGLSLSDPHTSKLMVQVSHHNDYNMIIRLMEHVLHVHKICLKTGQPINAAIHVITQRIT